MRNVLMTVAEQYWQNADDDHFGAAIGAGLRSAQFGCVWSAHRISFRSICFGASLPGTISVHRMNWEEQTAAARTVLEYFDRYRVATSAQYGNDATAETRKLADQHISILALMRSVMPPVQVETVLPGLICVLAPLAVLGFAFRLGRYQTMVLLPPAFYAVFILMLGSFTNGPHPRYLAPLLGFDLLVCIICFTNSVRVQRAASPI